MTSFLSKFKSRKFLTCVAGVVVGACMYFGLDVSVVDKIAGAVVSAGSIITYIYTEGKIDAAAVNQIKDVASDIVDVAGDVNKIKE